MIQRIFEAHFNAKFMTLRFSFLLISCLIFTHCSTDTIDTPPYEIVDNTITGIDFANNVDDLNGYTPYNTLYIYNGGGVAAGDINNDGLADLIFTGNQVPCQLYLNKGDLAFEDITTSSGVSSKAPWATGVSMADVNSDGYLDIYICRSGAYDTGEKRNLLYINNKDLTFTESAAEYGLDDAGASTQAYFFDFDNDEDLDAYVINHPSDFRLAIDLTYVSKYEKDSINWDRLYVNNGNSFSPVDLYTNLGADNGFGLSASIMDVNGDGFDDIFTANDFFTPDRFFLNQQGETLTDADQEYFRKFCLFSMGSDLGDIDNDGDYDMAVVDMAPMDHQTIKTHRFSFPLEWYAMNDRMFGIQQVSRNMLFVNDGSSFSDIGDMAGVSRTDWSWSVFIEDLSNNFLPDIFISNGIKRDYHDHDYAKQNFNNDDHYKFKDRPDAKELISNMPSRQLENKFFVNNGDLSFTDITASIGLPAMNSQGAALADLDNDGDLDIVVNNTDLAAAVIRNNSNQTGNHFLRLSLNSSVNTFCTGCEVTLFTDQGTKKKKLWPTRGFQSSSENILHFGLGNQNVRIDSLVIQWPDKSTTTLLDVQTDQELALIQPDNTTPVSPERDLEVSDGAMADIGLSDVVYNEDDFYDFQRDKINPFLLSREGPVMKTGDLNNDGRDDLVLGGAAGYASRVFLQNAKGQLERAQSLDEDAQYEDAGIEFLDLDGDGSQDLFISSGGPQHASGEGAYGNRIYINNGAGQFTKCNECLVDLDISTSIVCASDFDGDGDYDLFVGGRLKVGEYGNAVASYLLRNENGRLDTLQFGIVSGQVTDAKWVDMNNDGRDDLVVTGEWMQPQVLINEEGRLKRKEGLFDQSASGWWRCLEISDIDNDGDMDLLMGNWGLNSIFQASADEPITLYGGDMDKSGSYEPLIFHYLNGEEGLFTNMEEYLMTMPQFHAFYEKNVDFAVATKEELVPLDANEMITQQVHELRSGYFENVENASFRFHAFDNRLQAAPINAITRISNIISGDPEYVIGSNTTSNYFMYGDMITNPVYHLSFNDGQSSFRIPLDDSPYKVVNAIAELSIDGTTYTLLGCNKDSIIVY